MIRDKSARSCLTIPLSCLLFAAAGYAGAQAEISGGQPIVGNGNINTSYYEPSMVYFNNSWDLYVQGNDCLSDSWTLCGHQQYLDQVIGFEVASDWTALTSPMTNSFRILPCDGIAPECSDTSYYYGGPSAFVDGGQLHMTAVRSPDGTNYFNTQLLGASTNGRDWTWRYLLKTSPNFEITGVTLKYANIAGQDYWWGFMGLQLRDPNPPYAVQYWGIGAIRVHLSQHSNTTATPDYFQVKDVNNSWSQQFEIGAQITVTPGIISFVGVNPRLHSIGGQWQLWVDTGNANNGCGACHGGSGGSTFGSGFADVIVDTSYGFQAPSSVGSYIRCLPADYSHSRIMPEPLEGLPLLYSATNEINCREDFKGQYIVVTQLQ